MLKSELDSRKITTNYHLIAKFNFVFDVNGKISIENYEGSDNTKDILENALLRLNNQIEKSKHKIIPAKDSNGNYIDIKIKTPFQYGYIRG